MGSDDEVGTTAESNSGNQRKAKSAAHIVGFRVVLRVDIVLRVVNGVLVAVIVHSICIPNSCIFHISKTGLFEVLSLHTPSVTVDRRQL